MFATLGRLVDAHPWRVLALWAVAAVAVIAFSPKLSTYTSNNNSAFLPSSYQSVEAQAALVRAFPATAGASGIVVVSRDDGEPLSATDQQRVAGLATALSSDHLPSVRSVATSPAYLSPDKRVQLALVSFDGQSGQPGPNEGVAAVRHRTDQLLAGSGLRGGLTGTAAISVDSTAAFNNAEKIIGLATVLLILALLGIVFRSPVIAVLPIVVIGVVHQMAQGLTAWLAQGLGFVVGPDLAPLLLVVMFGVGTDYMVFLLFRYRERIAAGDDPHEALRYSVTRVGEVITSAAATVAAAFAALLVASLESLRTLAPGLIVGVALMLLAALTLVPAIISLFGRHLFWPTRPTAPDPAHRTRAERLGGVVARHPLVVLSASGGVLIGLAFAVLGFTTTYNQLAELPSSVPAQQAYSTMAGAFPPGYLGPTQVIVTSDMPKTPLDPAKVDALASSLGHVPGVATVAPARYDASRSAALLNVLLTDDPYSTTALNLVAGPVRRTADGSVSGATVLVGGTTSQLADVRQALRSDMSHVLPLALAIVAVILALLLRAVVAPLYLLVGVVLTYAATLGAVVLVFLYGFGFAGLDFSIPIIVYLFVMAIGTDYNILMASRLREEFHAGAAPRDAARVAVTHAAPAVTAAGLILAGTFASLLLTGIQLLQEIGFAVALGVLLSANLLATRIVPTLAALRGWHFWWPDRLHRATAATRAELVGPGPGERPEPVEPAGGR